MRIVLRIFRRTAANDRVAICRLSLILGGEAKIPQLGANDIDAVDVVANGLSVAQGDGRAPHRLATVFVRAESCRPLLNLEGLRTQHGHFLLHCALNDRNPGHYCDN